MSTPFTEDTLLADDALLAAEVAGAAGRLLIEVRERERGRTTGRELGRLGDAEANDLIVSRLGRERPDDAILSEESADDPARLDASRVWIIDPLDGSREYGMEGRDDWAVHVGLSINGEAQVGAVALPDLGLVLSSDASETRAAEATGKMVVSRSRAPALAEDVAQKVGLELVGMGSAGAKAMAVVRGEAEIYLHTGGQYEWDSAAPAAVALMVAPLVVKPLRLLPVKSAT